MLLLRAGLAAFLCQSVIAASRAFRTNRLDTRAPPKANPTIVQLFEWNWNSVAAECTNWLGPAGYGYAQVSPPQEHVGGTQWWTDYQPVSYRLESKRGNRAQFAAMVSTCNAAGVGIIVDTVLNRQSGTGSAGSSFSAFNYPAVPYTGNDFHSACNIDWNVPDSIRACQLVSLQDLKTETATVQNIQAAYMNDLLNLGVAGFRLDAAKMMEPSSINAVLAKLTSAPYVVQEVYSSDGDVVTPEMYTGNGDAQEFRACGSLGAAFAQGQGLSSLLSWPGSTWLPSAKAVTFVANHDTEREGVSYHLTPSAANNAYILASIFVLAHPYGTPMILSGYDFANFDQGAPLDSNNRALDTTCFANGWRCEHRWTAISNMVRFRNALAGTGITNSVATTANRISLGRGAAGHVAINYDSYSWTATLSTDVPDGQYCEILHDTDPSFSTCTGSTISVSGGKFTVTIPAYDAIAFYSTNGTPNTARTGVTVTFSETATTIFGQTVVLVGSVPQLGNWNPSLGQRLAYVSGTTTGLWRATVSLASSVAVEYKFVVLNADGTVAQWESDSNRSLTTATSGSQEVVSTWR